MYSNVVLKVFFLLMAVPYTNVTGCFRVAYLSVISGTDSDSDGDLEGPHKQSGVTLSYKSLEKKDREGPQDMGATSIVQIDTEVQVR